MTDKNELAEARLALAGANMAGMALVRENDMLRAEVNHLKRVGIALVDERDALRAENERLRRIERAARAAVDTEKVLGYVSLTLLSDVLDEA